MLLGKQSVPSSKKKNLAESPEMLTPTTKSWKCFQRSHKSTRPKQGASDLAGEAGGTGSAGSIQLCPSSPCHSFENQEWADLPIQTSGTAIKSLFSTHTHVHACTPLTLFSHFSPGILLELICSSSQGRIRILSTGIVTPTGKELQGTRDKVTCFQGRTPRQLPHFCTVIDLLKLCRHRTTINIILTLDLCRSLP